MHRSRSMRQLDRVTRSGKHVIHYERKEPQLPHCAICRAELNGIGRANAKGSSRRSNSRKFGGVLCAGCTGDVIKLASRVENGEMRLNRIDMRRRTYILQLLAH